MSGMVLRADQMVVAALSYVARGWAVFPPRGKLPAVSKRDGGNGYLDATTDPDRVRPWWKSYPLANVGIASRASGLLVLDADPRHGGDQRLAALRRHAAARGADGKSELAVAAGKASGKTREGDRAWALDMAIKRWHGTAER